MSKPILCLDFDGVIHSYTSPWQGATVIPDPPVPGALEFMRAALEHFRVAIYSSRSGQPGGIDAMRSWLYRAAAGPLIEDLQDARWTKKIEWPEHKPAAFLTIDDRALTFTGAWPNLVELLDFKPWNR